VSYYGINKIKGSKSMKKDSDIFKKLGINILGRYIYDLIKDLFC
jgi:hypothetical protein